MRMLLRVYGANGLDLLHVHDHLALVVSARAAHAVRELGLVASRTSGEIDHVDMVVGPAVALPVPRQFPLRVGHTFSRCTSPALSGFRGEKYRHSPRSFQAKPGAKRQENACNPPRARAY